MTAAYLPEIPKGRAEYLWASGQTVMANTASDPEPRIIVAWKDGQVQFYHSNEWYEPLAFYQVLFA
jgi:hypothetical protein